MRAARGAALLVIPQAFSRTPGQLLLFRTLGALFLGERLTAVQLVGGGLIITGGLVAALRANRPAREAGWGPNRQGRGSLDVAGRTDDSLRLQAARPKTYEG